MTVFEKHRRSLASSHRVSDDDIGVFGRASRPGFPTVPRSPHVRARPWRDSRGSRARPLPTRSVFQAWTASRSVFRQRLRQTRTRWPRSSPSDPSIPTTTGPDRSRGGRGEQRRPAPDSLRRPPTRPIPVSLAARRPDSFAPTTVKAARRRLVSKGIDRRVLDQSGRDLEVGMIATSAVGDPVEQGGRLVAKQFVHVVLHGLPQLGQRVGVHDAKPGPAACGFGRRPPHRVLRTAHRREPHDDQVTKGCHRRVG